MSGSMLVPQTIKTIAGAIGMPAASFVANNVFSRAAERAPDFLLFQTPLPATAAIVPATTLLRGGADTLDLGRVRMRLDGLSAYGVVTALMMNVALRMFSSTPKKPVEGQKLENWIKIAFAVSTGMAVISGAYTSVVFHMLNLYSKSALGLGKDDVFLEFFEQTASVRKNAFDAFLACLVCVKASFIMSVFLTYEGKVRWCVSGLMLTLAILSWTQWAYILALAGKLLFVSPHP